MNNTAFLGITVLTILFASLAGIALYAGLTLWQEGRKRKASKPKSYQPGSKEAKREEALDVWRKGGV